jgi:hypothetical protein
VCTEANIMVPSNLEKYAFTTPQCFTDMTQGYENLRGENCNTQQPEVQIRFKQPNLAYISKIDVQRESAKNPGNVRQIEVTFYDANNSLILDEITGNPVTWKSPEKDPTIWGYFKDVRGLNVKVIGTDNNENVRRLRVRILGCYTAGNDFQTEIFVDEVFIVGRTNIS